VARKKLLAVIVLLSGPVAACGKPPPEITHPPSYYPSMTACLRDVPNQVARYFDTMSVKAPPRLRPLIKKSFILDCQAYGLEPHSWEGR
jgi:hypothetical protein